MTVQTLKMGKQEFVVIPKRDFDRMQSQAKRQDERERQDAADLALAKRRSKESARPYSELRKQLGLA
jgi:hypothetical protein